MIYIKLAARNLSRSLKDYAIYCFTVTLSVMIFYTFNSLQDQPIIVEMCRQAGLRPESLGVLLGSISVFVSFVVAVLVLFSNNFIIRRRKRELGTYLLLGMRQGTVGRMLFVETLALGVAACAIGVAAGVVFAGIFSILYSVLMQIPAPAIHFGLSLNAARLTFIFYGLIFLGVGLMGSITVSRYSLASLLVAARKNEAYRARKRWVTLVVGLIALGMLGAGYALAVSVITSPGFTPANPIFILVALLVTAGSLGFFYAAIGLLMGFLRRVNRIHWRGLNAFTMGQIMKKVNSNTLVLTATNLLLAMTLTSVALLVFFQTLFNQAADQAMPYTYVVLYLSPDDPLDRFDQAARSNPQNPPLRQMAFTHFASDVEVKTLLLPADQAANEIALWPSKGTCAAMALSAYNALRAAKSLPPVALADGELAIQTGSWSAAFTDQLKRSLQQGLRVPFQGASYAIRQVLAQPINDLLLRSACTLVIPDALAGELPRDGAVTTLLYDYANPKDTLVEHNLEQTIYAVGHGYWESLPERQASVLVRQTIIMFAGLYLEMILLMACATVLGLQQLIETVESAQHYQTLRHLGAGEPTLRRSISQQVTFYFFAPAGLAILHSLFALGAFEKTFGSFVALSPWALLGSLALFLAVYSAYYLITLRSCVNLTRPPISPPC